MFLITARCHIDIRTPVSTPINNATKTLSTAVYWSAAATTVPDAIFFHCKCYLPGATRSPSVQHLAPLDATVYSTDKSCIERE